MFGIVVSPRAILQRVIKSTEVGNQDTWVTEEGTS